MKQPDTSAPHEHGTPDDPGSADEPVGSVAQEAFKLWRAVAATSGDDSATDASAQAPTDEHVCSTGWCPVCQVVGFVRDHPDAIASVTRSANDLVRSLRDLVDVALAPEEKKQ